MAAFDQDGCSERSSGVQPVMLSLSGQELVVIFPLNYNESNRFKMIGSPSEAGQIEFDNRVIQPSTVQFVGIVKDAQREVIRELRKSLEGATLDELKCKFQGKGGSISNMIIENFEEVGESNRYDGIEVRVTLQEYLEHNNSSATSGSRAFRSSGGGSLS